MSISVTVTSFIPEQEISGSQRRRASLAITGLTAGAGNTIPHGLPYTPTRVSLRPSALGLWGETSLPDGTNVYVTVGGGGATSGTIDLWE